MATPAAADTKKPEPKTIEVYSIRAVHGLMIHPFDETRFEPDAAKPHVRDGWVDVQIEAGKLEVVAS